MQAVADRVDNLAEAVELGAIDPEFYSRFFFPKTFRQPSPSFHSEIWDVLDNRAMRYCGAEVFRDGAKTTLCRTFTSRRIAYGLSHTILFIGKSEGAAVRSVEWLQRAVKFNNLWAQTFDLKPGGKWSGSEIEIIHGVDEFPIRVIALGITGSVRGINFDDYRPDLIVVDDPCDEENTATPEQRLKMSNLFFGAIMKSLAPETECPDAKGVLLQTPLDGEDLIESCRKDPQWNILHFSCFDDKGESTWKERYPTATLIADKNAHIARNQLSLWMREKECKIVSAETSDFKQEWLQYWDVLPDKMITFMAIDPVPPPSDREIKMGLKDKDWEVLAVVGLYRGDYYLIEYAMNKGHTPEWTIMEFFRLLDRWRPLRVRVESVAYQRTLKWLLEQAMRKRGRYVQISDGSEQKRPRGVSKRNRILQSLSGVASNKRLFVGRNHVEFVEQFTTYPNVSHDDVLEAVAEAVAESMTLGGVMEGDYDVVSDMYNEDDIPSLGDWRSAP